MCWDFTWPRQCPHDLLFLKGINLSHEGICDLNQKTSVWIVFNKLLVI